MQNRVSAEEIVESTFTLEKPAESVEEILSALRVGEEKKVDVLISLLGIFHNNIVSWTTRTFQAATWATGLSFAVVSYVFIHPEKLNTVTRILFGCGLLSFGLIIQLYLRAGSRAHSGNRLAISKCEAALGLYDIGGYLKTRPFFTYSKGMQASKSLTVIILFQLIVTIASVLLVFCSAFV